MKSIGCALALAVALVTPVAALSQTYPQRPIRIVVSFPPGGSTVLQVPEVKEYVLQGGSEVSGIPTVEARAKVTREIAMWSKVVKAAGIKIE